MWIPSHVGILENKRADVLANEGSISGTLFQYQAELTTVNTSDTRADNMAGMMEWQRDMPLLLFDITEGFNSGMDCLNSRRKGLFVGDQLGPIYKG
jgi:hypothetical protein